MLSSFISINTTIFYTFSNEKAMIQFELHNTDHNLNIVVDKSNLQHVMPLAIPSEDIPLEMGVMLEYVAALDVIESL